MDPYHQIAGLIAGFLSIAGYGFYIRSLLESRSRIHPNITSWILWSISYILIATSYFAVGARSTIWVPITYAVANVIILFLIFRRGHYSFNFFEKILLVATTLSVVVWIAYDSPLSALLINVVVNGMAIIPTFMNVYRHPLAENKAAWFFFCLADVANIYAIEIWSIEIAAYPIIAAAGCIATFVLLYRR